MEEWLKALEREKVATETKILLSQFFLPKSCIFVQIPLKENRRLLPAARPYPLQSCTLEAEYRQGIWPYTW